MQGMRKGRARSATARCLLASLAAASVVISPGPVYAANFGSGETVGNATSPSSSVNLGNDANHTYRFYLADPPRRAATDWAAQNDYIGTPVSLFRLADAASGTDRTMDVMVADGDYGDNGAIGWVQCPAGAITNGVHPDRTCYGQILRYNLFYAAYYDTTAEQQRTACHELGHTVGLRHTSNTTTCMKSSAPLSTSYFDSHDKGHLNGYY